MVWRALGERRRHPDQRATGSHWQSLAAAGSDQGKMTGGSCRLSGVHGGFRGLASRLSAHKKRHFCWPIVAFQWCLWQIAGREKATAMPNGHAHATAMQRPCPTAIPMQRPCPCNGHAQWPCLTASHVAPRSLRERCVR